MRTEACELHVLLVSGVSLIQPITYLALAALLQDLGMVTTVARVRVKMINTGIVSTFIT